MTAKDFYKGQTAYVRISKTSNAGRRIPQDAPLQAYIEPVQVLSVGRKYITVLWQQYTKVRFDIENYFSEAYDGYRYGLQLYLTAEDALQSMQREALWRELREFFDKRRQPPVNASYSAMQQVLQFIANW